MEYKDIMKIYRMNPIESYENILLEPTERMDDICNYVLITLYAVDDVIRKNTGKSYYYYIEDLNSIYYVLDSLQFLEISKEEFEMGVFKLDFSKLIYKFTCAKKFCVEDESVCQLRINSWGREYIKCKDLLKKYQIEYLRIREFVDKYYFEKKTLYDEIIEILLCQIDEKNASKICGINEQLRIKLLS